VSSTCFEYPSVHLQEDLEKKFYGISFMQPYKQSERNVIKVHVQVFPRMNT